MTTKGDKSSDKCLRECRGTRDHYVPIAIAIIRLQSVLAFCAATC